MIAPLDALCVDDLARILQSTKGSLIQQYRKLVRFHGADLAFTDAAIREIARIALARATGARGLRAVIEEVLEGGLVRGRGGDSVRDHGQGGQGWGSRSSRASRRRGHR